MLLLKSLPLLVYPHVIYFGGQRGSNSAAGFPISSGGPGGVACLRALSTPSQVKEKYKDYLYQQYAATRKALAAVRLFRKRQTGGAIFMAVGGALLGTLIGVQGTHNSSSGGQVTVTVSPLAYVLYPGPFIGMGIGKLSRFSDRRLYEALDGYDRTGTLPNYVQGRLRERDYQ